MGCNSHLAIEYKPWNDNSWECWALNIPENRDYLLYGYMAGVRAEVKPIVNPRGIASDLSHAVQEWFKGYGNDFHTHTWLTPAEFCQAYEMTLDVCVSQGVSIAKEWAVVFYLLQTLEKIYGQNKVRLVVAFDC
jgi:hypothetical protein